MSSVLQAFARQHVGEWLTVRETQSRDAIKLGRRTIAYVSIGADLWGQLMVERFNVHEELVAAVKELLELAELPEGCAAVRTARAMLKKLEA